jgi:rod shape-determining protein MreD
MKYIVRTVLVVAAAFYLHHALLPRVLTADFTPDLTLATVVYIALAAGNVAAVVGGFFLGLASDLFGWGPVGVGALVATLAAAVYGRLRVHIYEYSLVVPAVLVAVAALLKQVLYFVLLAFGPAHVSLTWAVVGRLALSTAVSGVAAVPLFFVYWRLIPPRRR